MRASPTSEPRHYGPHAETNPAPPLRLEPPDASSAAASSANDEAEAQGLGFFESDDDPWAPAGVIAGSLGLDG